MKPQRDISREQRKSATVRQCLKRSGDWTCLRPAGHNGACFVADEMIEMLQADDKRNGGITV